MFYRVLADFVLTTHFLFALFTVFGGFLVLRWRGLWRFHLICVFWGILVQWANWTCPLTPLENYLRGLGGEAGYEAGFVEYYIYLILYPEFLTVELRYILGAILIFVNLLVYGYLLSKNRLNNSQF